MLVSRWWRKRAGFISLLFAASLVAGPAWSEPYRCEAAVGSADAGTVFVLADERMGPDGKAVMPAVPQIVWQAATSRPDVDFVLGYRGSSYTELVAPTGGHLRIRAPRRAPAGGVSLVIGIAGAPGPRFSGPSVQYGFDETGVPIADVPFDRRSREGQQILRAVEGGQDLTVEITSPKSIAGRVKIGAPGAAKIEEMLIVAKRKIDARSADACTNAPLPVVDHRPTPRR